MYSIQNTSMQLQQKYGFRQNQSKRCPSSNCGVVLPYSLEISKAFDRVFHEILIGKLPSFCLAIRLDYRIPERSVHSIVVDGYASGRY